MRTSTPNFEGLAANGSERDHFKAAHVMSQCERCNESFYEVTERITHQELGECNPNESKPLRRGINDTQWLAIEKVIGGKQKHGIEKWFEIWHILFPNIPKPLNPYKGKYFLPRHYTRD